ncbi:Hydrogenase/urease accessory protein HupE [Parasphingorhabdus marina DSM 22363]|uniref:Hydrogenase/urease accessory protein HupE n=1 Tax=Parasphingorhabdus marina DSM 22363 TaxID=1123272 RepID=A0A1N6CSI3_9SPHN|nr:HupE/UreJ family protein [Parasphingorhabdus marina]SIN61492.1 Hydrogenase/urease accessory protein HupE [Parasphingorhabdus marina DSM 22363]
MIAPRCLLLIILLALFFPFESVSAHEIRPAALQLTETADGMVEVEWKQPVLSGRKLKMRPVLPDQCPVPETSRQVLTGQAVVETWSVPCRLDKGILKIEGLDQTLTDVFVRITRADGTERTDLLRPASAALQLGEAGGSPAASYLLIGAEHMLFGWDHLLFVLGLLLLTPVRQLLWVITAFTVGHSVTLAIVALGLFTLPGEPVELLIALSILFLAIEVVRKWQGKTSLTIRRPWLIALAFGLLHGLGFAGALSEIGLPAGTELLALLLFNMGVELGQILFVGLILAAMWLLRTLSVDQRKWIEIPAVYLVGGLGAFYTMSRIIT